MSHLQTMLDMANMAKNNAYAPYSHFHVGACLLSTDGQYFTGCNIENSSYSLTLCAEACAIAKMISSGAGKIAEIAVVSSGNDFCLPCGACRQRIMEFSDKNVSIHMSNNNGIIKTLTLGEIFPEPFILKDVRGS